MIVLDGMPGAGKTTLLQRLKDHATGQIMIYPEAQPVHDCDDREVARLLLKEAADRINEASQLTAMRPDLLVASDRCHIGVLAYRYALAATGRGTHRAFGDAIAMCHTMGLATPRSDVYTVVLRLDPQRSIARRAKHASDPRFALWFDSPFLAAYQEFLTRLDSWIPPCPELISIEVDDDLDWPQLAAMLPQPLAVKLTAVLKPKTREGR